MTLISQSSLQDAPDLISRSNEGGDMKFQCAYLFICMFLLGYATSTEAQSAVTAGASVDAPGESTVIERINDALFMTPFAYGRWGRDTTELFWDDGTPETYYMVSAIPGVYDRFAVRFRPPYAPPMKVVAGRFYTDNSVIPLQSFSVCRDAGGYPDVFHPVDQVDTVYGGYPGWGQYEFHGALFDTTDVWAVVHWIPGFVVGIGADSSDPNGASYWCNQQTATSWNQWTATDWMMRLSIAEVTDSLDAATIAITEPPMTFGPGDTAYPTAVFGNCGLGEATFDMTFEIYDSTNTVIYSSSDNITLASAETDTIEFSPEWVGMVEGMYTLVAYTSLVNDADPTNDTVSMRVECTSEIIITYAGDYTNAGSAIIGTWATNRKYLVRMTPPISPPFLLRRAEIFLCNENMPMEYVCICPDNGTGLPDTTTVLACDSFVQTPVDHTWATAVYQDEEVSESGDLWMIAKWPEGITEPHIGMTGVPPATGRSWRYYFRYGAGYYECMGVDPYYREWFFRLVIAVPALGIEEIVTTEAGPGQMLQCQPNPGRRHMTISFVPSPFSSLLICDVTGRVVRSFKQNQFGQRNSVQWDGTDDGGTVVSAGVYFVRLQVGSSTYIHKAILLE
jgi:hypothetical protein